jgi:hypothetical protein
LDLGEDGGCEGHLGELVAQVADFLALRGNGLAECPGRTPSAEDRAPS